MSPSDNRDAGPVSLPAPRGRRQIVALPRPATAVWFFGLGALAAGVGAGIAFDYNGPLLLAVIPL